MTLIQEDYIPLLEEIFQTEISTPCNDEDCTAVATWSLGCPMMCGLKYLACDLHKDEVVDVITSTQRDGYRWMCAKCNKSYPPYDAAFKNFYRI